MGFGGRGPNQKKMVVSLTMSCGAQGHIGVIGYTYPSVSAM